MWFLHEQWSCVHLGQNDSMLRCIRIRHIWCMIIQVNAILSFGFAYLFFFSVAFEVQVMIDFERFLVCVTFKRWSSCDLIKTHCFFFCKIDFIYYSLSFELFSVLFCSKSISSYQFMEAFCLLRRYYWVIFKYLRQFCVYF